MQIVINISEESYKNIKEQVDKRDYPDMQIGRAIADGTPLPKGHGIKWIPVSERLPEDSGEYLVSITDKEDEEYKQVGVAWFAHPKDYDIKDGEWRELMIDEKVTAWMPLPKPFEPQESEDKE